MASLVTLKNIASQNVSGIVSEIRLKGVKDPETRFRAIFITYSKSFFSCESEADPDDSSIQVLNIRRVLETLSEMDPEDEEHWRRQLNFYSHYDEKEFPGMIPEERCVYFSGNNHKLMISVKGEDKTKPEIQVIYDQCNIGYVPEPTVIDMSNDKGKEADITTRYSWNS